MHPAANQYIKHRMSTATPAQLVGLLYDGVIAALRRASEAQLQGDHAVASEQLMKGQRIVTELRCSLNFEAGEIATNLDAIYEFVWRQLVRANVGRDRALTESCLALLAPLRDAWAQALLGAAAELERKSA